MAFNLKKVLKALLFSSSEPLSVKDIQTAFARFHDQALLPKAVVDPTVEGEAEVPAEDAPAAVAGEAEAAEVLVAAPTETDADLYQDVPSLITATQIREAMDELASELRAADDIYLLIDGASGYRLVTHPRFAKWIRIQRDEPAPAKLTQSALETLSIVAYRQPVTRTEIETIRGVSAEAGLNKLLERELVYIVGRADLPGRPLQYGTTDKFLEFVGVKSLVELPASDVLSPRQIDEWLKNAINVKPPADAEMGLPLEEGEGETPNLSEVDVEHVPMSAETAAEVFVEAAAAEEPALVEEPAQPAPETLSDDEDKPASA
ncbi:SMC-Scp complex subunit ScpB [Rariglobus hedericola]|uniref:SMC-Scp complex subunit ScpB n=1 Tax=Rariglobus hedericola TaxID=2597822 RepID=A0A556QMU5_9BACT|nr:SMC-Scp complex subunit ScpB [Rariglobus hedericola]TSJ77922.1 SMC-Scp complex subunit ScpB [Rariglobus hedericola]